MRVGILHPDGYWERGARKKNYKQIYHAEVFQKRLH